MILISNWISQFDPNRAEEGFSKTYINAEKSELQTDAEM
jgi:hypothetical protein